MRLIDADALLAEYDRVHEGPPGKARTLIEKAPTIEPEIIRCRDCKHYYFADNRIPQEQRYVCDLDGDRWKPDDYCSFAERMKGEQE